MTSLVLGVVVTTRSPQTSGVELHNVVWMRALAATLQIVALVGICSWLAPLVVPHLHAHVRRAALALVVVVPVACACVVAATPSSLPLGGGRMSPPIASLARQLDSRRRFELVTDPNLESLGIAVGLLFAERQTPLYGEPSQAISVGHQRIAPPGTTRLLVRVSREPPLLPAGGVVRGSYDPPAGTLRRARAVQAEFLHALRGRGPVVLVDGTRLDRDEVRAAVLSGRFAALLQFDAVRSPAIGDRWFHALVDLEGLPLDYVRLVEVPAGT
jgi:hypothetical protein